MKDHSVYKDLESAVRSYGYGLESFLAMIKYGAIEPILHDSKPMFKSVDIVNLKMDIMKRSNEVVK